MSQRLKLNDVGQSNGEQELFVNGQSVLHITDLEIVADPSTKIYGIMAQTFFVSFPPRITFLEGQPLTRLGRV